MKTDSKRNNKNEISGGYNRPHSELMTAADPKCPPISSYAVILNKRKRSVFKEKEMIATLTLLLYYMSVYQVITLKPINMCSKR